MSELVNDIETKSAADIAAESIWTAKNPEEGSDKKIEDTKEVTEKKPSETEVTEQEAKPSEEISPNLDTNPEDVKPIIEGNPQEIELSNEQVIEFLNKKGMKTESIEELISQVNAKKVVDENDPVQVEVKKLKIKEWALKKKKIDPRKLEQFEIDNKMPLIELAYKVYSEERKGEINPDTDEEFTDD